MNPTVHRIGEIDWSKERGFWIPASWFVAPTLRFKNGKVHHKAILLLADLLYWYRPSIKKNETSGKSISKQKFDADKLPRDMRFGRNSSDLPHEKLRMLVIFCATQD